MPFLRESVYYSIHKEGVKRILKSSLVIKYIPPIWLHISLTLVSRWCSPVSVAFTCLFNSILVSCHITNEKLKQTQIALFLSEETRHVDHALQYWVKTFQFSNNTHIRFCDSCYSFLLFIKIYTNNHKKTSLIHWLSRFSGSVNGSDLELLTRIEKCQQYL